MAAENNLKMAAENRLEDYWEDASVSWGCTSSSSHTQQSPRDGTLPSYMQDFHISTSRPRNFPPPIALSTTLSTKAGGRFVLEDMAVLCPHRLRAEREQGRLCLHLVEPKDLDEDEEDNYNNNICNVEDTSVCAHHHQEQQHDGCKALATEDINERNEQQSPVFQIREASS